jgi:tRNA threonylcarbamoyladenosine biosynthesis protein TsaE
MTFLAKNIYDLDQIAAVILSQFPQQKLFCFNGTMGAGKTTFIKSFCKLLGFEGLVNSPTFPIINIYENHNMIFHIDCYRLKDSDEAIEAGIEDCFCSDKYCFVEWPSIIKTIIPSNSIYINIELAVNDERLITCKIN